MTKKTTKKTENKAPKTTEPKAPKADGEKPWKKYQDKFDRVTVDAEVPGVGTMKIDLVQVTVDGVSFRAQTRKECQEWARNTRKAKAAEAKAERDAERERKALEKAGSMGPAVTDRLDKTSKRLAVLAENPTVTAEHKLALEQAIALLNGIVDERRVAADADALLAIALKTINADGSSITIIEAKDNVA